MFSQSFLLGLTSGIALCTVTHYLLMTLKECLLILYPLTDHHRPAFSKEMLAPIVSTIPSQTSSRIETPPPEYQQPGENVIQRLEAELTVSSSKLSKMVKHLVSEMKKGLKADGQNLKMLPSFVVQRPRGSEMGTFLALDLGGSNFRVCLVNLEGQGLIRMKQRKYVVSEELKKGSGELLFDFFADCVGKFLQEEEMVRHEKKMALGFTFSFPVKQNAIDQGYLMHWNKGFTCSGVVKHDVARLLNDALKRKVNYCIHKLYSVSMSKLMRL